MMQPVANPNRDDELADIDITPGVRLRPSAHAMSREGLYIVGSGASGEAAAHAILADVRRENPRTLDHAREILVEVDGAVTEATAHHYKSASDELARIKQVLSELPAEHVQSLKAAINASMRLGYALATAKLVERHLGDITQEVIPRKQGRKRGGYAKRGKLKKDTEAILAVSVRHRRLLLPRLPPFGELEHLELMRVGVWH